MARRRERRGNFRYGLLAMVIAMVLWGIAHGSSRIEQNVDIPVAFYGLPDDIVITQQSEVAINVRVQGSRAALRNVSPTTMEYPVEVEGAKPGPAVYEVEVSHIEKPRGVRIVSRSPSRIELSFEAKGRKNVRIQADIEGDPPVGYLLGEVVVEPERVWLAGARSQVLRVTEVMTETIDVSELTEPLEKKVRLSIGSALVWMEESQPITVKVAVEPIPTPEEDPGLEPIPPDGAAAQESG
ncbi:MAG: YbbR-like domain-containing protein [Myxococcota bacterium]